MMRVEASINYFNHPQQIDECLLLAVVPSDPRAKQQKTTPNSTRCSMTFSNLPSFPPLGVMELLTDPVGMSPSGSAAEVAQKWFRQRAPQ